MYSNIFLDADLVDRAMRLTGARSKRAVIDMALQALVDLHSQHELRDLRGRLHWHSGAEPKVKGRRGADSR